MPTLEQTDVTSVSRTSEGFKLETADGQTVHTHTVIVATGITYFDYLPPFLADFPDSHVSHSSQHHDLRSFRGKTVLVLGAGASAVDIAAILHERRVPRYSWLQGGKRSLSIPRQKNLGHCSKG